MGLPNIEESASIFDALTHGRVHTCTNVCVCMHCARARVCVLCVCVHFARRVSFEIRVRSNREQFSAALLLSAIIWVEPRLDPGSGISTDAVSNIVRSNIHGTLHPEQFEFGFRL